MSEDPDCCEIFTNAESEDEETDFDTDTEDQITEDTSDDDTEGHDDDDDEGDEDDSENNEEGEEIRAFAKDVDFIPPVDEFYETENPLKPDFEVSEESTPLEILQQFLDDDIMNEVVRESNRYKSQTHEMNPKSFQNWTDISLGNLWQFMSVSLMMGLIKKPAIQDYWSKDPLFITPFFSAVMPRHRTPKANLAIVFQMSKRFLKSGPAKR